MTQENIDPIYGYIDEKIEAGLKDIKANLLDTQRQLARLKIILGYNDCSHRMEFLEPVLKQRLQQQLLAEASAMASKTLTSESPISLANKFTTKWYAGLRKYGINTLTLPD